MRILHHLTSPALTDKQYALLETMRYRYIFPTVLSASLLVSLGLGELCCAPHQATGLCCSPLTCIVHLQLFYMLVPLNIQKNIKPMEQQAFFTVTAKQVHHSSIQYPVHFFHNPYHCLHPLIQSGKSVCPVCNYHAAC